MIGPSPTRRPAHAETGNRASLARLLRVYFARHVQNFLGALGRLYRQPSSSLMTMAVIGIALALPAGLHVLVVNGKALGGRWDSAVDMSLYLHRDVTLEATEKLAARIGARADVAVVEIIPAAAALEEFRELSGFGAALDALTENPLPTLLVIRPASDHNDAEAIETLGAELGELPETDLVQMDTQWVTRFHAILDIVRRAVLLAGILLAVAVIIIVGNTIRLDIQNRRDEIEVTKLIGASDAFIRRPFLYDGLWYGFAGGLIALLLITAALWLLHAPVQRIAGLYGSAFQLEGLSMTSTLALMGGGAVLGWLGSWIAATRHMREIEPGGNI